MTEKNQNGFTLMELLITISILGIIYVTAIPQYIRYREKAERASVIAECRSLYRSFVIFYITYQEYPYAAEGDFLFDKETFFPLTDETIMAGATVDIEIESFKDRLDGRKAEKFDSPDDMGDNQEFYLILPWQKDPSIKFVIASADNVTYEDGTVVDGGNWIDGVYMTRDGAIITR